jgi:hypothetical protein
MQAQVKDDANVVLRERICEKWTEFDCLNTVHSGGLLWIQQWNFGLHWSVKLPYFRGWLPHGVYVPNLIYHNLQFNYVIIGNGGKTAACFMLNVNLKLCWHLDWFVFWFSICNWKQCAVEFCLQSKAKFVKNPVTGWWTFYFRTFLPARVRTLRETNLVTLSFQRKCALQDTHA